MRGDRGQGRITTALLAVAIFIAPFLAFLFRVEAGLALMAIALGATSFLLWEALADVPPRLHRGLRLLIGVNLLLALACLVAAGWLLLRS